MPFSSFSIAEILLFFAVLVRMSVMVAIVPFLGDRTVPTPVKILFSLAVTFSLFPTLIHLDYIHVDEAARWGMTTSGIVGTTFMEVVAGLVLGFSARLIFEAISFGANLAGTFMGFSMANIYDPHMETQSQVFAQLQMAIAMLLFIILDGHHFMIRAMVDSFRIAGIGHINMGSALSDRLVAFTTEVIRFGVQVGAPVGISIFAVNIVFGVLSKAMPQLNVLSMSFAVTILIGLVATWISMPEFGSVVASLIDHMDIWMRQAAKAMAA